MSRRRHPRRATRERPRAAAAAPAPRLALIDALRGFALCLMLVYHMVFDLVWLRGFRADFNHDPFWLAFRGIIVTLFLSLVGVSLVLARRAHQGNGAFWRRVGIIAACAALVTAASYVTFPQSFITFGVLHCIALSSVLARPLVDSPRAALLLGIAVIAVGNTLQLPLFDTPWLNWIGLMTHKPPTEDYVPLLPWTGVVLLGVALGHGLFSRELGPVAALGRSAPAWLAWLGRHSLLVYLVHQPLLVGILRVVV